MRVWQPGGHLTADLIASANGAEVSGVVSDSSGQALPNAIVIAAPEPRLRGRVDSYRKTVSDQNGHFTLKAIRPGEYTLLAWESVDENAFYNPEFLKTYESRGVVIHVTESDRKSLQMIAIPSEDQ